MRYFITFIFLLLLVIFGIVIFKPNSNNSGNQASQTSLADYADTGARAVFTYDGAINGDDIHRQIRITVDNLTRTIDISKGYQGQVIRTKSYENNEQAYTVFLSALYNGGFTKQRKSNISSEVGVCPLGQRFIYQLSNTGSKSTDIRLWSTSCGGGTQGGSSGNLQQLFQNQITDYADLTADVQL